MIKELQDIAWNCLPKEFKEEVKAMYNRPFLNDLDFGYKSALLNLFGHNLTSDAEGEDEMLYVKRKWVQEMYKNNCDEIRRENISSSDKDCYEYVNEVLKTLFGSKCLPDEVAREPASEPASEVASEEPKFKVGEKVRISCAFNSGEIWDSVLNGRVATIAACYRESNNWIYCFEEPIRDFAEFWLEPCTEQGTLHCPSSETECYIAVPVPKMDERRLNIAAMMAQAILTRIDDTPQVIAETAFRYADALIAGCKKE